MANCGEPSKPHEKDVDENHGATSIYEDHGHRREEECKNVEANILLGGSAIHLAELDVKKGSGTLRLAGSFTPSWFSRRVVDLGLMVENTML